ncbi:ABC transporter ATP-binding protein [Aeromicrobium sp. 9AM]|uniref:ABC transporter ATP-binding protein n=1 Tax=Aeromicrobium sp. 9AM TaxID=2653126 RepID=UPI0012F1AFC1|nr:ABC transporter ATP-binding protein [Aeromicrobium sp. 9AM]VXC44960.1 ABC transporter (ATP-binding protein) involved in resistance to cell wall inhibitors [Aeromicrobium sp. 9AM]
MTSVLRADGLTRTFGTPAGEVTACEDISLHLEPGELLVVRGPSGSGKTTLLNLLGGLDRPTSGTVMIDGHDLGPLGEDKLAELRQRSIGFVFQSFGLLPVLTAAENVEVPLRIRRMAPAERDARVVELLDMVGLAEHGAQRPDELSGGQQQRVGIARALAVTPQVLLADEPTGQLDSRTAGSVMDLIVDVVHRSGVAAVVATHDQQLVERADKVLTLHDGRVVQGP